MDVQKQVADGFPHSTAMITVPHGVPRTRRPGPHRRRGPGRARRAPPARTGGRPRWPPAARAAGGTRSDRAPSPPMPARGLVGLKNSDFHDAGPTAQPKSSASPLLLEPVRPGSLDVVPAGGQIVRAGAPRRARWRRRGRRARWSGSRARPAARSGGPRPSTSMTASSPAPLRPTYAASRRAGRTPPCSRGRENDDQRSTVPPTTVARSTRRLE